MPRGRGVEKLPSTPYLWDRLVHVGGTQNLWVGYQHTSCLLSLVGYVFTDLPESALGDSLWVLLKT